MSRQLDQVREERERKRELALIRALEYELPDILDGQGIILRGFSVIWQEPNCLLTLRAVIGGKKMVSHMGGISVIDSILNAVSAAKSERLRWKADKWPGRRA